MKKLILLLASAFSSLNLSAQSDNALYFDNFDDHVTVPGASAGIVNSNAMSMTMWIYPENTAPAFPDFDGFGGFRNNSNADFYLLQLTGTNVEARFRNSAGTAHDILFTGLVLNTWQHFAMTYDGATLSLYHNGVLAGSIAASGNIASAFETFYLGMTPWPGDDFYTNGKLDEASLWSKALTPAEISCIYTGAIDPTSANLELYYRFNQGIAGGVNGTVNTLSDATGSINGTLNNFTLSGPTSNWVAGAITANSSVATDVLCPGTAYTFGSQTITTPGTYYEAFPTSGGCDSIAQLVLTTVTFNSSISQVGPVLTANQLGAAYQWIDCTNGNVAIAGATNQTYTATANGQYAVILTLGGCSDTTVCATVTNVGLNDLQSTAIAASPNPFNDYITLSLPGNFNSRQVIVYDVTGREVYNALSNEKQLVIPTASWTSSVYYVTIDGVAKRLKLIKQ